MQLRRRLARKRRRHQQPEETIEERSLLMRLNVIYGFVFLAFVSLILRLGYLQVVNGPYYQTAAMTTTMQKIPVLPARGRIYDNNGNLLAYDEPYYSVFLTQLKNVHQNLQQISVFLAPGFNTTPDKILKTIHQQKNYATIRLFRNISNQQLAFVTENQSRLPGVTVELDSQRRYTNADLAGHVLGFVRPITAQTKAHYVDKLGYLPNQKVGQSGIELQYEKLLQGKTGYQLVKVNNKGTSMQRIGLDPAPVGGRNLQLTIDGRVQASTQESIMTMIDHSKYKKTINDAAAVMLDVKTGGVLALASYPYYDPNWYTVAGRLKSHLHYLNTSGAQENNVIQNPNYPGSTVKPANLITGLETGAITPGTAYYVPYSIHISSATKHDDAPHGFVNNVKAVAVSSDVFFYQLGLRIGGWLGASPNYGGAPAGGVSIQTWRNTYFARGLVKLFEGERRLGMGQLTHIDLPGEEAGRFYMMDARKNYAAVPFPLEKAKEDLNKQHRFVNYSTPVSLALSAIGQEQQFTPIQLAQYVATIANNGTKLQPHLLKAVLESGIEQHLTPAVKVIRTNPKKIQDKLNFNLRYLHLAQQGMYGVCNDTYGTAYADFRSAPYKAAGKTGTADIYLNGVHMTNSVFIAYAPYKNPQVAVAVMVPGGGYGAQSAALVARQMLDSYFKEQHEFFPKNQWTSSSVPSDWKLRPAYTNVEKAY
ncbi:penicillin-binding protein 2 [Alicyclobacillus sp. SO9]|uniref:peptidoglycan D,D-transpeptidase FtsI family protein n=1 Tax=Alicyclobacillus sp. SO9 TaxID=2665646 RepID=UPI0018E7E0D1|nr:penicillin-binding transpeptidase domain-containing protein [Alicyclobacillus sp. SO9]QQE79050.1 peptidoglycan glycosyltransferase [Alicyclobacillus sp. SO9]